MSTLRRMSILPDPDSDFGRRVRNRLTAEQLIWLTSTARDGTPQPNPVWFVWEDPDIVLVYNRPDAHRLTHVAERPRVALHFDANEQGGDIVVLSGRAGVDPSLPGAAHSESYLTKYRDAMIRVSGGTEEFARQYSVALRVQIDRVRGF